MNIMDLFHNLLKSSTLLDVGLFGLFVWQLLAIGMGFIVLVFVVLAVVFHFRANQIERQMMPNWQAHAARSRALRSLFVGLAIFLPFVLLFLIAWPILWVVPILFLVGGLVILFILFRKMIKWLPLIAGGLVLALLLAMLIFLFGGNPFGPKICMDAQGKPVAAQSHRIGNQFGPQMPTTKDAFIAEWVARGCADAPVAAAVSVVKDGSNSVALINQTLARFNVSRAEQSEAVEGVRQFMEESTYTREFIPAGSPTLYEAVLPDGSIEIRHGATVEDGWASVFTHPDGRILKLREECGGQPIFEWLPTGPACTGEDCPSPVCPSNPELPYDSKKCLESKDPALDVESPDGWTQLPAGPKTTGQESEQQQEDGDTSGNVIDDQVADDTGSDDVTTDTTTGTTVVIGGSTGGDTRTDDVTDDTVVSNDDDGTTGATEITNPDG